MATKRIKFLNRKKIFQKDVEINLEILGPTKRFAATLKLDEYKFPPEAHIFIDAKQLLERIRFNFGTIALPGTVRSFDISRLKGERVTFDVIVIDTSNSRKLGTAETVRPAKAGETKDGPRELLPIDASRRLGDITWKIEYSDTWESSSDAPVLLFDSVAASNSAATFVQNNWVRALVLPAAMRQIMTKVLVQDNHPFDSEGTSWRDAWIRFAANAAGLAPPQHKDSERDQPTAEIEDWIGTAVERFAARAQFLTGLLKEVAR